VVEGTLRILAMSAGWVTSSTPTSSARRASSECSSFVCTNEPSNQCSKCGPTCSAE
jgi:hypothetical protein